jgi:hypothetical protein
MRLRKVIPRALPGGACTVLLVVAAGCATSTPVQISTDPYTNASSQHATQVEPDSFSAGNTIVAATQSGRFFDGGASNIQFATSTDGGANWTDGGLPGLTVHGPNPGPFDRASDPVVAFSAKHNVWMIGSLGINEGAGARPDNAPLSLEAQQTPAAVVVNRSTDGGTTWGNPVTVAQSGNFPDKNWTACDNWPGSPFFGNCYTEYDENGLGNRIKMSTSTNGGLTWGAPLNTANTGTGLGGMPVSQPNGTVVVPIGSANLGAIQVFRSINGGASWGATSTITQVQAHTVAGNIRAGAILSADVDASGRIYVVWHDCRFRTNCSSNDLVMTTSTDGVNWTPVVRIPIDPLDSGRDHFIPGLAVDHGTSGNTAHVAASFYYYPDAACSGDGCELHAGFVESTDGGQTWSGKIELNGTMRPSWIADTSQGRMVGDYISTSFVNGKAWPVYSFAAAPSGATFAQSTFAAKLSGN